MNGPISELSACKAQLRCGTICNTGFSIRSDDHLREEVERLRNHNGLLDGKACRACGVRYLAKSEEFVLNGAHQRTKDNKGNPITNKGAPRAVLVLHKPCKGKKGARISISLPHEQQKITKDNLRILGALLNSAASWMSSGCSVPRQREEDRHLADIRSDCLARKSVPCLRARDAGPVEAQGRAERRSHRTSAVSRGYRPERELGDGNGSAGHSAQLLDCCSTTADARSGYVYRLDLDFDPRV